jgi:hypothetical protein
MNWLLSYNHSGNGWIRYCIEYLTGLPTHGHQKFSMSERNNNFLNVDLTKEPIVTKRHELCLYDLHKEDKIILLLRDPFVAIKEHKDICAEFDKYERLIEIYENFTGKKLTVNFNHLFHPSVIKNILMFYDISCNELKFDLFKNNLEYHSNESKKIHKNEMNQKGANLYKYIDSDRIFNILNFISTCTLNDYFHTNLHLTDGVPVA